FSLSLQTHTPATIFFPTNPIQSLIKKVPHTKPKVFCSQSYTLMPVTTHRSTKRPSDAGYHASPLHLFFERFWGNMLYEQPLRSWRAAEQYMHKCWERDKLDRRCSIRNAICRKKNDQQVLDNQHVLADLTGSDNQLG
ncbi:LOW QUALITY PROTEIN: hypothetical protein M8C21_026751, partial [Ambrosia artemisiifolia]